MGFRKKIQESPKVDLTPMIDVVFLLLIFFMISTTFVEQTGLNIKLPDAGADQIEQKNQDFHIYLTQDGRIYLDRDQITKESLLNKLNAIDLNIVKRSSFILMADQDVKHGLVVEIMDMARAAGFTNLAIATDPKPTHQQEVIK